MRVLFSALASLIQLVQLFQQNCGVELVVVTVAESLHCLVYGILVLIVEQVGDFSGPIHGLDGNLDHFQFVGQYDMVHGPHVASGFDLDGVAGSDLHGCYVIGRWAHLIGADRSN